MDTMHLMQFSLYGLFFLAVIAYATLDGFDLGVGCLHYFAKDDTERRVFINSIGPFWDGNTTWVVISGGVLFAAFPRVFTSLTSAFYTPVMMLLFGYMLRGAAIEFRSKKENLRWRKAWDFAFFFSSLIVSVSLGMVLGNLIDGLPLDRSGEVILSDFVFVHPYAIVICLFAISLFVMHGSIFLLMKTEGALHDRIRKYVPYFIGCFVIMWLASTFATYKFNTQMMIPFKNHPWLSLFALLPIGSISLIPHFIKRKGDGKAFIFSCLSIFLLLGLFAIGMFPNLVYSTVDSSTNSLTYFNCSSTALTLKVLLIVALSGSPLSFFYFSYLYRVFRGKISLDSMSY